MVAGDLSAQSLNRDKVFTIIPTRTSARNDTGTEGLIIRKKS